MRLSNKEIAAIKYAFQNTLTMPFSLYLFGSRTDDLKKGGDIDLLILVDTEYKQIVAELKSRIRLQIFEKIPEQRIDMTVATWDESNNDPFLCDIMPDTIKIL